MKDVVDLKSLVTQKKRKNSKAKGNAFERKVCGILNEKFNTKEFSRTPGSGAYATSHNLPEHLQIYGDLITPKGFKFIIECKKGYNKEGICSIFNENSILNEMIAQASRDAKKSGKLFMLIIGQDRQDPIVISSLDFGYYSFILPEKWMSLNIKGVSYYIVKLKDLLSSVPCEYFFNS